MTIDVNEGTAPIPFMWIEKRGGIYYDTSVVPIKHFHSVVVEGSNLVMRCNSGEVVAKPPIYKTPSEWVEVVEAVERFRRFTMLARDHNEMVGEDEATVTLSWADAADILAVLDSKKEKG